MCTSCVATMCIALWNITCTCGVQIFCGCLLVRCDPTRHTSSAHDSDVDVGDICSLHACLPVAAETGVPWHAFHLVYTTLKYIVLIVGAMLTCVFVFHLSVEVSSRWKHVVEPKQRSLFLASRLPACHLVFVWVCVCVCWGNNIIFIFKDIHVIQ